jgi:hypothetical protein
MQQRPPRPPQRTTRRPPRDRGLGLPRLPLSLGGPLPRPVPFCLGLGQPVPQPGDLGVGLGQIGGALGLDAGEQGGELGRQGVEPGDDGGFTIRPNPWVQGVRPVGGRPLIPWALIGANPWVRRALDLGSEA